MVKPHCAWGPLLLPPRSGRKDSHRGPFREFYNLYNWENCYFFSFLLFLLFYILWNFAWYGGEFIQYFGQSDLNTKDIIIIIIKIVNEGDRYLATFKFRFSFIFPSPPGLLPSWKVFGLRIIWSLEKKAKKQKKYSCSPPMTLSAAGISVTSSALLI